ncbi:tonsoku-like protein [Pristis pectinata]|uniref:tonsoku-like protein n=1 Tax=Pristis pectinata TaxID=685728 RepID=UPI00223D637E|nr:tonsoku-like protein [Pristis pectinata]
MQHPPPQVPDVQQEESRIQLTLGDFSAASLHLRQVLSQTRVPASQRHKVKQQLHRALKGERLLKALSAEPATHYASRLRLCEELGDLCCSVHCYQKGVEYYQQQLACAEMLSCPDKEMAVIHYSLARTYHDLHDYRRALSHYQRELELQKGNDQEECKTWLHIAAAQQKLGTDWTEVEGCLQAAGRHAQRAGDPRLQHKVQKVLGKMQKHADRPWEPAPGDTTEETESDSESERESEASMDLGDEELPEQPHSHTEKGKEVPTCRPGQAVSVQKIEKLENTYHQAQGQLLSCCYKTMKRISHTKWKRNAKGETPLHRACIRGDTQQAQSLIQQGHPLAERDNAGWTPLHEACNHGWLKIVTLLLDSGAAINSEEDSLCGGTTVLHDALTNGCLDIAQLLIDRGALTKDRDNKGRCPADCLNTWMKGLKHQPSPELKQRVSRMLTQLQNPVNAHSELRISISDVRSLDPTTPQADPQVPGPSGLGSRNVAWRGRDNSLSRRRSSQPGGRQDWKRIRTESRNSSMEDDESFAPSPGPSRTRQGTQARTSATVRTPPPAEGRTASSRGRVEAKSLAAAQAEERPDPGRTPEGEWLEVDRIEERQANRGAFRPPEAASRINGQPGAATPREETAGTPPPHPSRSLLADGVTSQDLGSSRTSVSPHPNTQAGVSRAGGWCSTASPALIRVRVRVKDKLFLVPVPHRPTDPPTVSWLASEAATRYTQTCGTRPRLSLTSNGALLSPTDPLLHVLQDNEEVEAEVVSWDLDPISTRYKNACRSLGLAEDPSISKILQLQEDQPTVDLCSLSLSPERLIPVLRALRLHTATRELRLSANRLTDSAAEELLESLLTMPNLTLLDISSNQITGQGLRKLSEGARRPGDTPFQSLQELNLSHNPLGEGSSQSVAALIAACPVLSTLRLQGCGLTTRFPQDAGLNGALRGCSRLETLDVSGNPLGPRGVQALLRALQHQGLSRLELSTVVTHAQDGPLLDPLLTYLGQGGCVLTHLSLSNNGLTNDSVTELASCLPSLHSLAFLDLSRNPGISFPGLQMLLEALDQRDCCLELLDLSGCSVQQEDVSDMTVRWYLRELRL